MEQKKPEIIAREIFKRLSDRMGRFPAMIDAESETAAAIRARDEAAEAREKVLREGLEYILTKGEVWSSRDIANAFGVEYPYHG